MGEEHCCVDCAFYSGEECSMGPHEGAERYDDSLACEVFEPSNAKAEGGEG